jgi:hypothetical protein
MPHNDKYPSSRCTCRRSECPMLVRGISQSPRQAARHKPNRWCYCFEILWPTKRLSSINFGRVRESTKKRENHEQRFRVQPTPPAPTTLCKQAPQVCAVERALAPFGRIYVIFRHSEDWQEKKNQTMINSTRSGHKERWLRQLTVVAASSTAAPQLLSGDRIVLPTTALTELDSFIQPGKPVTLELLSGLTKAVRSNFHFANSHSTAN